MYVCNCCGYFAGAGAGTAGAAETAAEQAAARHSYMITI